MSHAARVAAGFAVGSLIFHLGGAPPPAPFWSLALAGSLLILSRRWAVAGALCLGLAWSAGHATDALQHRLDEATDARITATVVGLPQDAGNHTRFTVRIRDGSSAAGVRRAELRWYGAPARPRTGERWRLTVTLQPPRGRLNPGGFDEERWLVTRRVDATGTVHRGQRLTSSGYGIDPLRSAISVRLRAAVNARGPGAMLAALAVGDRRFLDAGTWDALLATGTNHLVAISGLHVGLAGGLGLLVATAAWRRISACAERVPAPVAGAVAGLATAAAYAALAGFTIPTQRALLMLAVPLVAMMARRPVRPVAVLVFAAAGVLVLDPFAPLDPGFWLSFAAVAVLGVLVTGRGGASPWWRWPLVQVQLAAVIAPMTLLLFNHVAPLAPLANLFAIPLVGFFAVPLALAATAACAVAPGVAGFLAEWCAWTLWLFLEAVRGLASLGSAVDLPAAPSGPAAWGLVLVAVALVLAPGALPGRLLALPLLAAALTAPSAPVARGQARITVLDVGYGHASVVKTASGRVLVDTGPAGRALEGLLAPDAPGAEDHLVLTRDRAGHRGGTTALPEPLPAKVHDALDPQGTCARGAAWDAGGVHFRFLDPDLGVAGCVLLVTTERHRWLFATGVEPDDRPAWRETPAVDGVVLPAGGHGEAVTRAMLSALQPRIAVLSVDADNRYGLPHPETLARLRRHGVAMAVTGTAGAVTAVLGSKLEVIRARDRAGWWNRRPPGRPFGPGGESFIMQPSRGGPDARAVEHRDEGEDRRAGNDRSGRLGDGSHHPLLGTGPGHYR